MLIKEAMCIKTTLYLIAALLLCCSGCKNPWYGNIVGPIINGKDGRPYPEIPREYLLPSLGDFIGTITGYTGPGGNIAIPAYIDGVAVTNIANGAPGIFQSKGLTGVTIPSSVTFIGQYAFAYNELTNVTIPVGVTSIGIFAFYGNDQMTSVTFMGNGASFQGNSFPSSPGNDLITLYESPSPVGGAGTYTFNGTTWTKL